MKKIISLLLAVVMAVGMLAGLCFAADPIAEITNGTDKIEVTNHKELEAMLSEDGTSVVKMLKDYTADGSAFINGGVSFTLDLNGHTVGSSTNNGVTIKRAGTTNSTTVIKNGTVFSMNNTICPYEGGIRLENVNVFANSGGYAICLRQTDRKWNDDNLLTGCYIGTTAHAPFAFGLKGADQTTVSCKIENSTLIHGKNPGGLIFGVNGGKGGTVELGKSVVLMTRNYRVVNEQQITLMGEKPTQTAKSSESAEFALLNHSVSGLHKWETPKGTFADTPVAPEVEIPDFADVAKDFWGYEAIMNAAKAGLVKGKSENADGTFNYVPNAAMTRAEFVTVICRYFYPDEAKEVTAGDTWWRGYYDMAIDKEILQASELDGGELDKPMTREEMALVLSRTAPSQKAYESVTMADSAKIPDYASVGEYYQTSVLWAYGAGLLKGVDAAGTFNPQGELNRAAVATIFNTLLSSK